MAKKTRTEAVSEPDDSVKLKPIAGIRPGVYLTVIYSIIILLLFFWLFIFHGLNNYGTVLDIKTEPQGAAVRVNGVYMGTSGTLINMPNWINPNDPVSIEVVLPGFEPQSGTYNIPGRVFGSRFFPRRHKLEFTLQTADPAGVLTAAAGEFAAWTFGGEPTEAWQIPMVLSEAAYRIGPLVRNEESKISNDVLHAASRFAVTRASLRDLIRAKFLLDNGGNAPSPVAVLNSTQDMLIYLSENEGVAGWLASLLQPETANIIKESNWFKNGASVTERQLNTLSFPQDAQWTRRMTLAGLSFTGTEEFYFCETVIPKTLFETFLSENPEWADHYIDYFKDEAVPHPLQTDAATGMSWYAAEAFCKWLTGLLPPSMADYEVRLPAKKEWIYGNDHVYMFVIGPQGGWEWCADPYAPLEFINADSDAILAVGSPERVLLGRRNMNPPAESASLPPDFRSPVVSFRAVIVRK